MGFSFLVSILWISYPRLFIRAWIPFLLLVRYFDEMEFVLCYNHLFSFYCAFILPTSWTIHSLIKKKQQNKGNNSYFEKTASLDVHHLHWCDVNLWYCSNFFLWGPEFMGSLFCLLCCIYWWNYRYNRWPYLYKLCQATVLKPYP